MGLKGKGQDGGMLPAPPWLLLAYAQAFGSGIEQGGRQLKFAEGPL